VLTTYAGLLFRDLLDRFGGDSTLAVGAYNGGPGRPNLRYEAGVRMAAEHARRVLEQAAALNGEAAAGRQWLTR
jgi:soluble lytic murein transglycosylase-like protein